MREQQTNCWTVPGAQALCIPTNGTITKNGHGVMGRGVALQARHMFMALPMDLGWHLETHGNHVGIIRAAVALLPAPTLIAFPVKHQWREDADLELIARSADELIVLTNQHKWSLVVLPRPGCGNGRLEWAAVKPILEPKLDDRFLVVWQ